MPAYEWGHGGGPWMWRRRQSPAPVLAVLVGAIQLIGTRIAAHTEAPGTNALDALGYALILAGPAALVARRRWPAPVLVVNLGAAAAYLALDYPRGPFFLAALVALFTAARRVPKPVVWTVAGVAYLGYLAGAMARDTASISAGAAVAAWLAVAVALAEAARVRAEHFAEVRRSIAEANRARQEQALRKAADERLRIAQELHDVLGHHLSLINMRAGVALHLLDAQPEQAREALDTIKQASAEALREVRGVIATLRPAEESAPRSPSPSLDQVEQLGDGLALTVRREGQVEALPAEVDRAAYRIVQESLTNVRRHAPADARVTVTIGYAVSGVTLRIENTGTVTDESISEGNGIPGMRERAAALGGRLTAGPRPHGGFVVEAELPVRRAEVRR